jgi:hypothetical protein
VKEELEMARGAAVLVAVAFMAGTMTGCGGTCGGVSYGAATGFVYVPGGGGAPIIVCQKESAPPGYVPAEGAVVSIVGVPGAQVTIGSDGSYTITNIPPGEQTLEVVYDGQPPVLIVIIVVAGQTTCGSGHSEGGG